MKSNSDGVVPIDWMKQPQYKGKSRTALNKLARAQALEAERLEAEQVKRDVIAHRAELVTRQILREDYVIHCGWRITLGHNLIKIEKDQ